MSFGVIELPPRAHERLWADNGFASLEDMEEGHHMILSALGSHFASLGDGDDIVDLGAGNGELLRKLARSRLEDAYRGVGVESDEGCVIRRVQSGVRLGRIQDVDQLFSDQQFALAIISVRRFEELDEDEIKRLATWFARYVDSVLVYQYDFPIFARMATPGELEMLATDPERGRWIVGTPDPFCEYARGQREIRGEEPNEKLRRL